MMFTFGETAAPDVRRGDAAIAVVRFGARFAPVLVSCSERGCGGLTHRERNR